ncbi:hypothetical protein JCM11251_003452 [Rhodosporidiobolus azoricus]
MDQKESEQIERDQLPPRDYLSTLPVEILSEIFRLACVFSEPPTGPICRALLPFDRSSRFHLLQIKSVEQLRKVADLVDGTAMGGYVRELKLEEVDSGTGPGFKDRQLKSFFASLPLLTHLELGKGCQFSLRLILSNSLARASLRNMTSLSIEAVEAKNPFDPAPLRLVNLYPALQSLTLYSEKPWYELKRVKMPKKKVESLNSLQELTLTSKGADLPIVSFLVSACTSLSSLTLSLLSWPADFQHLLPLLPGNLKRLELKTVPSDSSKPNQPCDHLLSRFANLEHLYLGEGLFHPNILDLVRTFPRLTSFGLGILAVVDCKELLALVDGPTRFLQLKTLILDVSRGKRGWRVHEDGHGRLHPDADPHWHTGPGWVVPFFTYKGEGSHDEGFHEDDAKDLIQTARRNGVTVGGTTEEAIRVIHEWYMEMSFAATVHAIETGDFEELREYMGDDYVDELLYDMHDDCGCGDCESDDGW